MSNTTTPSVVALSANCCGICSPTAESRAAHPPTSSTTSPRTASESTAVTAVGDRSNCGRDLVSILADNHVNVAAQVNDYPTGITAVRLDDGGIPEYDVVKGVAWDHIEFTDEVRGPRTRRRRESRYGTIAAREAWGTRDTIYRMIDAASPERHPPVRHQHPLRIRQQRKSSP